MWAHQIPNLNDK